MTTLLYHSSGRDARTSPFDDAVLRVAQHSVIKIVSPYIGLSYLQRLISISTDWMLVSDIEAWLSSLSSSERVRVLPFIHANLDRIHHYPAIHAKTVISPKLAYLGSANLTAMGILNRTEMGVLIEDVRLVQELNDWFDGLWTQTTHPDVSETIELVQWLDQHASMVAPASPKKSLSSSGVKVRSSLTNLVTREDVLDDCHTTVETVKQQHNKILEIVDLYEPGIVIAIVDSLVAEGFSFRAFLQAGQRRGIARERQRDFYFALLPFCANHPRSIFGVDTINRLLFVDGVFMQSTPLQLSLQQAPYDDYLSSLIRALSFDEARIFPSSSQLFQLTGLREVHQHHLLNSLLESGLLLHINKSEKFSARYMLKKDFKWSRRFQLFAKAYKSWNKSINRLSANHALFPTSIARASEVESSGAEFIEVCPLVAEKNASDNPEASSHSKEKANPMMSSFSLGSKLTPLISTLVAPRESLPEPLAKKAVRIERLSNREDFIEAIEPKFKSEASRIDELYLHLAKILESSTGFFNFKSVKSFVDYIYAHYGEDKEFIGRVLNGKTLTSRLFYISISPERECTACMVKLNTGANMNDYPKTYKFMMNSVNASMRTSFMVKKKGARIQPNPGFFVRTVGYKALAQCDPKRRKAAIKREDMLRKAAFAKEEEARQKTLAARQASQEARTLEAIKMAYARAEQVDQVFEALFFFVQIYGNPLPLDSMDEIFTKISDKTGLKFKCIEEIFQNKRTPFTIRISKKVDGENCCYVEINQLYSGNFETLPKTKSILATGSLKSGLASN